MGALVQVSDGSDLLPAHAETGRLRLARCVVEDRWPLRRAAERFQASRQLPVVRHLREQRRSRGAVARSGTPPASPLSVL